MNTPQLKLKIAIVGKANVGKSTLFNRICSKKIAIIHNKPGITRDRKEFEAHIGNMNFIAVDTAGWEDPKRITKNLRISPTEEKQIYAAYENSRKLKLLMIEQTKIAVENADIILFLVDGRSGITEDDKEFVKIVRKVNKKVILLVNKSESKINIDEIELYKFGFGNPIFISSSHGLGMDELYEKIQSISKLDQKILVEETEEDKSENLQGSERDFSLAIIGRPNAGKSTLFNKILNQNRSIVSDLAGTTRDAIDEIISLDDENGEQYTINLIDTAGIRKKAKIQDQIENFSLGQSITSIKRANVVILLMDAQNAFEKQDMAIAKIAINEGKSVILIINKFDLVKDIKTYKDAINDALKANFTDLYKIQVLYISAIKTSTKEMHKILNIIFNIYLDSCTQFSTSKLNKWLNFATSNHTPPLSNNGRRIKIKYSTQVGIKPITLKLYSNIPEDLPRSYKKYLINSFCEFFDLKSIVVRIIIEKNVNPYEKRK